MTATISDAGVTARHLVGVLRNVLGEPGRLVPLHEPLLGAGEKNWVADCLDSGWVSSVGPFVTRFEEEVARVSGVHHAIVVSNGTSALQVCMLGAGVAPGDEVIVPSLTFVATANAVSHCGAIPHFVDAERQTMGLDPVALAERLGAVAEMRDGGVFNRETGRRIAAIVPVHIFGHPVQMDEIVQVARQYDIPVVEDGAESLGSLYKARPCGGLTGLAALSFNGNKIVTTGGGGAVLVEDDDLARRLRHLCTTGKLPHKWHFMHDIVAFNYRMPNLNAALGLAQMERLESFIAAKRALTASYAENFHNQPGMRLFTETGDVRSNYWLNTVLLDNADVDLRERVLEETNAAGYQTRPLWTPLHRLPMYRAAPRGDLAVTDELALRIINVPSGAALGPLAVRP